MDPRIIPLKDKREFLENLSEDEFRDKVIRPLFLRKGFRHGAELCGMTEEGKDCYFVQAAPFGGDHIYVVQTKIGNINLGREPSKSLMQAETQMKTALATPIRDSKSRQKRYAHFAFLCTSGEISHNARDHLIESVGTPNLTFLDVNDLVPEIDEHFSELWQGIKTERFPYLDRLADKLWRENDFAGLSALIDVKTVHSPISEKGYIQLKFSRSYVVPKKVSGQVTQHPKFEELGIEDLLTGKKNRYWLIGEPGAGKSTALKKIAETLCKKARHSPKSTRIPILVKAASMAARDIPLAQHLGEVTGALTPSGNPALGVDELTNGLACVLVDALDEIGTRTGLAAVIQRLKEFEHLYPKNLIIVTSRNYSYLTQIKDLASFTRYNVSPISFKEATRIMLNVGGTKRISPDRAKEMLRQLENIHGFELNPLVVTVFAASADSSRRDIPCNITELFAKFVETMLGRWDTERGLSHQYEAGLKQLLLQGVALKMHQERAIRIKSEQFKKMITDELEELGVKEAKIDVLLHEIIERSGLVLENEDFIEFRHLLIQEFFAGRALKGNSNIGAIAIDEWWQRAIVFCFGSEPQNEAGLRSLCESKLTRSDRELFTLATTVGLAAQAAYFVKIAAKCDIMDWVIRSIAQSNAGLLESNQASKYPLHSFLMSYLMARDSVAAECLSEVAQMTPELAFGSGCELELREFWLIVGLMESGHLDMAFDRIKKFHPANELPNLALHLGAFLISHVRSASLKAKKTANAIVEKLQPRVAPLVPKYLKEFKSQLLEWQGGEVKELEPASNEDPQFTLL